MTNKEAIEILKTESCADCSCHPESPMSCINTKCPLIEATLLAIKALEAKDRLLKLCEQCEEENGQTRIHINDVRLILAEGGRE